MSECGRFPSSRAGFTLIELLLVLAILGLFLGVGAVLVRPPSARLLANDIKAMLYQSRYEAVQRNQPVAFVYDGSANTFRVVYDSASAQADAACGGDTVVKERATDQYRGASVAVAMSTGGIVWLPTGLARTCAGAPSTGGSIGVTAGGTSLTVTVDLGGKVSVE